MPTVKAIIFDVAGVVVNWNPRRAFDDSVPPEQVEEFLASSAYREINRLTDAGHTLAQGIALFNERAPQWRDTYLAYLDGFQNTVSGPIPGTTQLIHDVQAAGFPVYGLSNWAAENFSTARRHAPVLATLQGLVVSGEVGYAKPDPAIFTLTLDRFSLDPSTTVMIDDSQENLESAAGLGLIPIHFTTATQARAELVALGVLP